jgi:hypothetical protein
MKTLVASALLALSLVVCLSAVAQENPPAVPDAASAQIADAALIPLQPVATTPARVQDAPSDAARNDGPRPGTIRIDAALLRPTTPVGVAVAPKVEMRQPKIVDKRFMTLGTLVFATTSLDMELTQHCLQRNQCIELNPTLPTSHWGMYATNTPVNAAVMWLSYKRRKSGHWDWWVWPAIDAGIHLYGVSTNAGYAWGGR